MLVSNETRLNLLKKECLWLDKNKDGQWMMAETFLGLGTKPHRLGVWNTPG